MWLSKSDYERLVTQAAQSEFLSRALESAQERAENAEKALQGERAAKDWLMLQLASRVVTKHGQYGLDHENPVPIPQPANGYTHEPTEMDYAKLEYYKTCARNAGKDEQDAVMKWEAEMRGEGLTIETEAEQ